MQRLGSKYVRRVAIGQCRFGADGFAAAARLLASHHMRRRFRPMFRRHFAGGPRPPVFRRNEKYAWMGLIGFL